jgi:hypothetical protein
VAISPNYLWVGDEAYYAVYGWHGDPQHIYPIHVRIKVVMDSGRLLVEAVDKSDDPMIDNEWVVSYKSLRRTPEQDV